MATDRPRFNLTTKEMEASASNNAEAVQVRPHWVFRLLGRKHDSAAISGDRLEVRVGNDSRSVSCADSGITIRKRFLGADLLVAAPTGTTVLRGLPTAEALRFSGLVRLRGSRPKLRQVSAELAELLESAYYLNRRRQLAWAFEAQAAVESLADVSTVSPPALLASDVHMLDEIRRTLHDLDARVAVRNAAFVAGEMERYGGLFESVESYPLSARQIEAILHDEDHALVVAGAGTGKTSTVVGKIAYLLKSGIAKDHEILALAYNRKAATEMSERAHARLGRALKVRTFHALGLQVVTNVQGARPAVSELAADQKGLSRWIGDELDAILRSPSLRHLYLDFAVLERDLAKAPEEFRSAEEFQQYVREQDPRTITGIRVRSFEERLLADWMTLHGVAYEYERPYEHNTATATARQYKPDFYLTDYAIYVEHFGVDRSGATASYVDRAKYHAGMEWKRDLHRRRGTRLIETFSYERMDGTYRDAWRTKFERAGVALRTLTDAELQALLAKSVRSELADLLATFLVVTRENIRHLDELHAAAEGRSDARRCAAFLALFEEVHTRYTSHLRNRGEIDFADMVASAAEHIESGRYTPGFRRIVVDEFQDISRGRLRLLTALLRATPDARILCVGDDWQSIYGFAGSDVGVMVRFAETFGFTKRTDLDLTFRFNDRLLSATSRFVQENPIQLRKDLSARTTRASPAITVLYDVDSGLDAALHAIAKDEAFGGKASVLVLGRYNATEPHDLAQVTRRHPNLNVSYLTVHKSKGLEADYVVVLDVAAKRVGFPSQLESDPLLTLVLAANGEFRYAEERRLFYVALTRARHRVFVCTPPKAPSAFSTELETAAYDGLVSVEGVHEERVKCPQCRPGYLTRRRVSESGHPWVCSEAPRCAGKAAVCPKCRIGAFVQGGGWFTCSAPGCNHALVACPSCGQGYLREYMTRKGPRSSCSMKDCGYRAPTAARRGNA